MKKTVGVIGAGPAGLTAGYQLCKLGYSVEIFESSSAVGGMSKSFELWGQKVDLGPHRFFSNEKKINEVWLEVIGTNYSMVNRLTRIYYKGKFFFYPLKPLDALSNLGVFEALRCIISYILSVLVLKREPRTFEDWVKSRFGNRLFQIFFKTYSEKLWGIKCDKLDSDFAAQRIKKLSLFGAVWNAFVSGRGNRHKTLVDQFAYPYEGTGSVYEAMAKSIKGNGGQIHLETGIDSLCFERGVPTGLVLRNGMIKRFDHIISTMPITSLVKSLPNVPSEVTEAVDSLKFRNTILVYLEIDAIDIFPDNWLYIHSPDLKCGRVTNFSNWNIAANRESKKTILCMEYWAHFDEELWTSSSREMIELAKKEIRKTGLLKNAIVSNGFVCKIPRSYPVYASGYRDHLSKIIDYLDKFGSLTAIGRYGSFKYNNQDHSILMGILAAENIGCGARHDLWNINCDDEYQEEATISNTGLLISQVSS